MTEIQGNRQFFNEVDVSSRFLFYKFFNLIEPYYRRCKKKSEVWIAEKKKNQAIFKQAERKFMRELDVKNILQSNVKTRFLFSSQLNRQ